ncbi:MAG: glutamyl-tRNA reductase [Micromonosporaceae bacterium]
MNLLVVGVSHRTAPVTLLERLAAPPAEAPRILGELLAQAYVGEAVLLSTCNRVEVYTAVSAFHGGLTDIAAVLATRARLSPNELAPHLYVHYEADAVRHAYRVAAGLDSMVVGESQILGQLRDAYAVAAEHDTVGRLLHELMQQALRVGKRAHAETGIDRAGQSVVKAALELAAARIGAPARRVDVDGEASLPSLQGVRALVVGAGAMGALALATLRRAGAAPLAVANRGADRAARLADAYDARAVPFGDLGAVLPDVDLVLCATAAPETVLTEHVVRAALDRRGDRPLFVLDLAVPRDVDPAVADLPGVVFIDIERLSAADLNHVATADVAAAEQIVADEVEAFLDWLRGSEVVPTVAALRARADEVVAAELQRLAHRRPDLTDEQRAEVAHTVHRVVRRLLHSPTVRARELAARPDGRAAAALLRELFDLQVRGPRRADEIPSVARGENK